LSAEHLNDDDLSELVRNAVAVVADVDLAEYVRWNFRNLLDGLDPDDIGPHEYMALNVILARALSRKLALAELPRSVPSAGRFTGSPLRAPLRVVSAHLDDEGLESAPVRVTEGGVDVHRD
jgi:hypothetical protein